MSTQENNVKRNIQNTGFLNPVRITDTLQGSIWRAFHSWTNSNVVIKVTKKQLHDDQMIVLNGEKCRGLENIVKESSILEYLTSGEAPSTCIVKYWDAFECNSDYYLIMSDGGRSLFEFTLRVHQYISVGMINLQDWHKMVKLVFKQMVDCLEYIHSKNVCHFDLSLENFVIDKINVQYSEDRTTVRFCFDDDVQCRLCDFGLAEHFENTKCTSSKYCGKTAYKSPEITTRTKTFDAKQNDIFSLGVCLFMLVTGNSPWITSSKNDDRFTEIMNGHLVQLLKRWNKEDYVNDDLLELLNGFFQYEAKRITLQQIKKCSWLNPLRN